ncbi:MAG: hypothetical protein M1828_001658 [Chrysothrix sp. TS-e1954]|nr:MAG: hypothetical protein M1828_001658 [Chrysothrix sp. TS-e1954]
MAKTSQDVLSRLASTSAGINESNKYQSPPPPAASMTPPPSSQLPQLAPAPMARTPTPTHSHLSSPPPTIRAAPAPNVLNTSTVGAYSQDTVSSATMDELRAMLAETTIAYREARASAAHQALQYNLLWMESSESMKRMNVELDMAFKEVEVLQAQHREAATLVTPILSNKLPPTESPIDQEMANLKNKCSMLEIENEELRHRCQDLASSLEARDTTLLEENDRLRSRIRENRDHLNLLRRSSHSTEGTPYSVFTTPQRVRNEQRTHPTSTPSKPRTNAADEPFAQLLMAGEILSNTTPSTPTGNRRQPAGHHQRNSHSLSSLPATPYTAPAATNLERYRASHRDQNPRSPAPTQRRRRESRDSTISASDIDEAPALLAPSSQRAGPLPHEEAVYGSRASQEATNMLRKASFRQTTSASTSQTSHPVKGQGKLNEAEQGRLYGKVSKPYLERPAEVSPSKRKRVPSEMDGVGLGIGGWNDGSPKRR